LRQESVKVSALKEKTTRNLSKLVETFASQPKLKPEFSKVVEPNELYRQKEPEDASQRALESKRS